MLRELSFLSILIFLIIGCSEGPKIKANSESTMRPYTIKGKTYHPTYVNIGDTMRGVSSWYGPNFHGKYTSNGEVYNMYGKTAAHKTWPMNTMILVENLDNGKSVVVRINDRGPFVRGRVIDCSYSAGKAIGLDKSGIARVKLTVLGFAGKIYKPNKKSSPPKVKITNFGVQVGAFKGYDGAKKVREKYRDLGYKVRIKKDDENNLYRVLVLDFKSEDEAESFVQKVCQNGIIVRP